MSYHINDAVNVAEANRIGHGVDIMHESKPYQLINTLLNKNILVEINLTSNEALLGVQGNRSSSETLYAVWSTNCNFY